jgi:hypothetical protein
MSPLAVRRVGAWAARGALALLSLLGGGGCMTVQSGQLGLKWTPGGLSSEVYGEGYHYCGPLEAVLIRDVVLPMEIQRAINDKLEAEQQSLKEKFVIEKSKQEAERARVEAEGEAERARIRASGDADAQRIAAKASDDANQLVEAHASERVLKWQQLQAIDHLAQAPNTKVVLLPEGKTVPMLQIQ